MLTLLYTCLSWWFAKEVAKKVYAANNQDDIAWLKSWDIKILIISGILFLFSISAAKFKSHNPAIIFQAVMTFGILANAYFIRKCFRKQTFIIVLLDKSFKYIMAGTVLMLIF